MLPLQALTDLGVAIHRQGRDVAEGVPLYSIMRNEYYFLPHFLAHYRRLGVRSFMILADRCEPRFLALLEAESDVTILTSNRHRFGDVVGMRSNGRPRRFTSVLKEAVSNRLFHGRWHLVVDSDEFLILPPPFGTVGDYTAELDRIGLECPFATMVDFYPPTLAMRNFPAELAPFEGAPYFDEGPLYAVDDRGEIVAAAGGIRARLLSRVKTYLSETQGGLRLELANHQGGLQFKFPLLKATQRVSRDGDHRVTLLGAGQAAARKFFQLSYWQRCVLAHFKFYPGLDAKLELALSGKEYSKFSLEYQWLDLATRIAATADLVGNATRRYEGAPDLIAAGYMERCGA